MADKFVPAASIFVTLGQIGDSQWVVFCLVSITRNYTTNIIDAGSICKPTAKEPGIQDMSVDMTLQRVWKPIEKYSEGYLHNTWRAKKLVEYTIGPAIPVQGDLIETGTGYITNMVKNDTHTELGTMDITITCTEVPIVYNEL